MTLMSAFLDIGRKVIKIAKSDDEQAKVLIKEGPFLPDGFIGERAQSLGLA